MGLSPFARGNLGSGVSCDSIMGPIPVRTGEPLMSSLACWRTGAYPRSHGGTNVSRDRLDIEQGLSPFARGNHQQKRAGAGCSGPIPVRTGEPSGLAGNNTFTGAYPRSHGGTNIRLINIDMVRGLSPFARGNRQLGLCWRPARGPIPVRTGEPHPPASSGYRQRAYPRSHGGTTSAASA